MTTIFGLFIIAFSERETICLHHFEYVSAICQPAV